MSKKPTSFRYMLPPTPLSRSRHIYLGETNEHWTHGETYMVISSGYHWFKAFGYGLWVTCDEVPNTTDEDYGVFIEPNDFSGLFFPH